MPDQFDFIILDGPGKPKGSDRSLIRSRCMQGKNKRDSSRRSIRQKKRIVAVAASNRIPYCNKLPPPPPADLALVPLVGDAGPRSQELLYKVMTCDAISFSMSPLTLCVDFDLIQTDEFNRLFYDSTFLSAILFTCSAVNDLTISSRRQPSMESSLYLHRTLLTLNAKLSSEEEHCADSTMIVVITLALLAAVFGDWVAARAHMAGLHRVIELRGGLKFLRQRPKLHYKVERLDLSWTLSSGGRPFFSPEPIIWDRVFTSRPLLDLSPRMRAVVNLVDTRLVTVYEDFQYLSVTINENVRKNTRWKGDCFQNIISSIQARLLCLMTQLKQPLEEYLSLAMLALLTTSFKIPGRRIPYSYLANRFRKSCCMIREEPEGFDMGPLELWGLMVGAISVFEPEEEPWLIERVLNVLRERRMGWQEVQRCLQSVMWIECIHDEAGKKVFERMAIEAERHGKGVRGTIRAEPEYVETQLSRNLSLTN